jgi:hypothetical protein
MAATWLHLVLFKILCHCNTTDLRKVPEYFGLNCNEFFRIYVVMKCGKKRPGPLYMCVSVCHSFMYAFASSSQQCFLQPTKFRVIRRVLAVTNLSLYHAHYEFLGININFVSATL